jgi:hypothetical protein
MILQRNDEVHVTGSGDVHGLVEDALHQEIFFLNERLISAEADRRTYRELVLVGLETCAAVTAERNRLRRQRDQLVVEVRQLKAAIRPGRAA